MSKFKKYIEESTVCGSFGFSEPGDIQVASTDMNSDEMKDIIGKPKKTSSQNIGDWKEDKERIKKFGYNIKKDIKNEI